MDFQPFDQRRYVTVSARDGYEQWAATYDECVKDAMDIRLLQRVRAVQWEAVTRAVDLACGTGRIGEWLRQRGVAHIDGIDQAQAMLELAQERGVYERLETGDVRETPFEAGHYDLVTMCLADEHLPELSQVYGEAARLLVECGFFVIVGYHPQFLMTCGMPTHYHEPDGSAVAIETYVHLLSDHISAAQSSGLSLREMHEGVIDDQWIAVKPKWQRYEGQPVSFVMVYAS